MIYNIYSYIYIYIYTYSHTHTSTCAHTSPSPLTRETVVGTVHLKQLTFIGDAHVSNAPLGRLTEPRAVHAVSAHVATDDPVTWDVCCR